jgi:hypothetical protein
VCSHGLHCDVPAGREFHFNRVTGLDHAATQRHAYDPGLSKVAATGSALPQLDVRLREMDGGAQSRVRRDDLH